MGLACGFGISGCLAHDASHAVKLDAVKEFAQHRFTEEFFELIDQTVYRFSFADNELKVEVHQLFADAEFLAEWEKGHTSMSNGTWMDIFYDEAALFIPNSKLKQYDAIGLDGINNGGFSFGVDDIENGFACIDSYVADCEETDDAEFAEYLKGILDTAKKNKFVWGAI